MGLVKSTLRWLDEISADKTVYPYTYVSINLNPHNPRTSFLFLYVTLLFMKTNLFILEERVPVFWRDWGKAIQENFERHFWIPVDPQDDAKYKIQPQYVNRR